MNPFSAPNAMVETLLANLPVGILVYENDTGKCLLANQAAADMLGGSVEALRQQNFQTFVSKCQLTEAALHHCLSGHYEVTFETASDKITTLDCCISRFDYGGNPHRLCTISDITEPKGTQEKLERERALLRCVIDSASDLIFIKDQESVYRGCNKASEAFIGMPESEQIGKTDYDFFDREKAHQICKADKKVIDEGKPVHYEEWVTGPDGRRLLMDTVKTPYYDPDGKPLGLVGISRDLTERNRLEQDRLAHLRFFENMDKVNRAIQGTDDLEKMMMDLLDVVLSIFDSDRAFLLYPCDPDAPSWNIPMERTKPEYPGAGVLGIDVPTDPEIAEVFRVVLESDKPLKFDPETKTPLPSKVAESFGIKSCMVMSLFPVNSKAWQFGLHQCSHARVWTWEEERLFREIGRRLADALGAVLAQRDLRRSLEKLEQAARIAHVGYWERDLPAETISLSEGACQIFGLAWPCRFSNLSEWHAQWLKLIHPEDRQRTAKAAGDALAGGPPYKVTYRVVRPDGDVRDVHSCAEVTRDAAGKPLRMFGTMIDITERKQNEEALRRLNLELDQRVLDRTAQLEAANKELESFAYSVSHDLRAPLRHIDGFLQLLQKNARAALDEQGRHYMDTISNAAQKMGMLIDDLLTFSRMGRHAMSLRQVALGPLVRDVIIELEPDAAGRAIAWRIGELPVVRGDKAMLRMVLVNLVANALKFTRPRRQAKIQIGSLPGKNSEAVIFVRDNGAGFDMAYAGKLFGVFQRLHRTDEFEGIGIGLANVHRIIARHGGRTWAEGKVDRGATFYFSLP
ncbi:MAG: PAS domain S-box protein [Desulfobacteraceae bacterium]|jgi:PAS domain S-box-containing protein